MRGSEANKRRPAVIVSNNHANAAASRTGRGVITVVPLTSNVARVLPLPTLRRLTRQVCASTRKVQAEQVRPVALEGVGPVVALVPAQVMAELDEALRLHLQLERPTASGASGVPESVR